MDCYGFISLWTPLAGDIQEVSRFLQEFRERKWEGDRTLRLDSGEDLIKVLDWMQEKATSMMDVEVILNEAPSGEVIDAIKEAEVGFFNYKR